MIGGGVAIDPTRRIPSDDPHYEAYFESRGF